MKERNGFSEEMLLSDDELDLIWCLPYITDHQKLAAIARAQMERVLEFFREMREAGPSSETRPFSELVLAN